MRSRLLLLAMALLLPMQAPLAQVAAVVEGVQMPAWFEREGRREPLVPGMELRAGDQIVSGEGARIAVRLAEGSIVKLGQNGQLRFTELSPARELFKAALSVLEGAFRFTTDLAQKSRRREVSIRAAQVTAGIRGTDFWGRSRKDNEIVCLIEGEIEVAAEGESPLRMDQARQFYRRIDGKTQPVGVVDEKQLAQWAGETDMAAGRAALRRGGRFSVLLAAFPEQGAALALYDELRNAGYPAEIAPVKEGASLLYRLRIRQIATQAAADALAAELRGRFGITEPKVGR
jgi:hypothetical protein